MKQFQDKVALVTGSSRGIGRGIALCLAEEGADLIINYYSKHSEAKDVLNKIQKIGQNAIIRQADVADRNAVKQMFTDTIEHFGYIDIVVANAAINIINNVVDAKWEDVQRSMNVSLFGVYHTCQMAARQMVKQYKEGRVGGKIIIISSIQEEITSPGSGAYNMSKAAINHLGRTMALELAPFKINVNIINPGVIETPSTYNYVDKKDIPKVGKRIPWGRIGTPDDIGKAVVFLASDDADYITGSTLRVDGGFVLIPPSAYE